MQEGSLCEGLLMGDFGNDSMLGKLGDGALGYQMAEVNEPGLLRKVLRLAVAAAQGNQHLADGERPFVDAARRHWSIGAGADEQSRSDAAGQAGRFESLRSAPRQSFAAPAGDVARGVNGWREFLPSRHRSAPASAVRASGPRHRTRGG